jgi:hypothetical protein
VSKEEWHSTARATVKGQNSIAIDATVTGKPIFMYKDFKMSNWKVGKKWHGRKLHKILADILFEIVRIVLVL